MIDPGDRPVVEAGKDLGVGPLGDPQRLPGQTGGLIDVAEEGVGPVPVRQVPVAAPQFGADPKVAPRPLHRREAQVEAAAVSHLFAELFGALAGATRHQHRSRLVQIVEHALRPLGHRQAVAILHRHPAEGARGLPNVVPIVLVDPCRGLQMVGAGALAAAGEQIGRQSPAAGDRIDLQTERRQGDIVRIGLVPDPRRQIPDRQAIDARSVVDPGLGPADDLAEGGILLGAGLGVGGVQPQVQTGSRAPIQRQGVVLQATAPAGDAHIQACLNQPLLRIVGVGRPAGRRA